MKNSRLLDLEQLVRDDSVRLEMTGGVSTHYAPVTLDLLCGCRCTVLDMRSEAP